MARILWLSGEYLLPADSGLYRYSLDMMNALGEMGHDVHAIGRRRTPGSAHDNTDSAHEKQDSAHEKQDSAHENTDSAHENTDSAHENTDSAHENTDSAHESTDSAHENTDSAPHGWTLLPHRQPPMWKKMLHTLPVKVVEVWDADYAEAVTSAIATFKPEIVLFDHLRTAAALDLLPDGLPSIYVSQNDETAVKQKMIPAATGVRKMALWVDLKKIERFEDRLLSECEGVSAISVADIETFRQRGAVVPIVHTLPSYRGSRIPTRTITHDTPRRLAMISTLYWGAKIDNMVMALRGLQPVIDDGVDVVVFTGGYQPPAEIAAAYPTVTFEGYVDDFDAALADCRVGVVYEPVGGGFKMKTLDFIFHRVPLVTGDTSAMSLPLTPGTSVEQARNEQELGAVVREIIDDIDRLNALQNAAFDTCRELFTSESARDLSDLVDQITSASLSGL